MNEFLFNEKPFDIVRRKPGETPGDETSKPYLADILTELGKIRVEIVRMQKRMQSPVKGETQSKQAEGGVSGPDMAKALTYLEHVIREIRGFKPELLSLKGDLEDEMVNDHIKDLLPVVDAFSRVLETMQVRLDDPRMKSWFSGINQIYNSLMLVFKNYGVEEIPAMGLHFDPKNHSAVATVSDPSQPNGTIVRVDRMGFKRKGIVIRYPEVVIVRND